MDFVQLESDIRNNKYQPERIFRMSLDAMSDSFVATTATMPIISLLEHQVACTTANNTEIDLINKNLNPGLADTHEALARHLDYSTLNTIHAKPTETKVVLSLGVNDIQRFGMVLPNGNRRVVIPEHTIIGYQDDMYFALHHAVQVTLMDNQTIDVNYIDNDNPLMELDNPVIEIEYLQADDLNNDFSRMLLRIPLTVYQFRRTTHLYPINSTLGFNKTYTLTDQYYHARVFTRSGNDWIELDTYFSEFIYSKYNSKPAAVVKLEDNQLNIQIPQIYFSRGMIGTEVKVVLHTTKGNVEADYRLSLPDDWSIEFTNDDYRYSLLTEPLAKFDNVYVHGTDILVGGQDIPTLEQLRKLIQTSDESAVPITKAALERRLTDMNYSLVHEVNYPSDNVYVASRRLDNLTLDNASVIVESGGLDVLLDKLKASYGVIANGSNFTITPNAIARLNNGVVNLLTTAEATTLKNKSTENLLADLNDNTYLKTPFYYLVEDLGNDHLVSVFDMDEVGVTRRNFIGSNQYNTGLIATRDYSLVKVDDGYQLQITAITNDTFMEYDDNSFIPQLRVVDSDGNPYVINGTFIDRGEDGEFNYTFDLNSTYDLSYLGTITLSNLVGINGSYPAKLTDTFSLTYNLVKNVPSEIDTLYRNYTDNTLLPTEYQTLTLEELTLNFGKQLTSIYTPSKSFAGSVEYQRYTEDQLAYYPADVYETDNTGHLVWSLNPDYPDVPGADPVIYNKLHSAGDQIFKEDGVTPELFAEAGSLILDGNGQPIPIERNNYSIMTKLLLVDYKYGLVGSHIQNIKETILYDIEDDIEPLETTMLGLTKLRYNLGTSLGKVSVRYDSETTGTLEGGMSFDLTVMVDSVTYKDAAVRNLIIKNINTAISNYITDSKFAVNALFGEINALIGDSVDGFDITAINGRSDVINFTLMKETDIIGIRSKLTLGLDNKIKLVPDINILFKLSS